MENWIHINNILWTITELRLADLYKLFLWDYSSRKEFEQELNDIYVKNHAKIKAKHDVDIAKRYRED